MSNQERVLIVGGWHLGVVAAANFAAWGHEVLIWDKDPSLRERLRTGNPPVAEPALAQALLDNRERITVHELLVDGLSRVKSVLIAYDTPVDDQGRPILDPINDAVAEIAAKSLRDTSVVLHSQVPVGTGRRIQADLRALGRDDIRFAETPENLRLGTAMQDFISPGFMTVGSDNESASDAARSLWRHNGAEIVTTDFSTCELSKHVINSVLATSTALGNEIASVAYLTGADAIQAAVLAKRDRRIAALPIIPGMPFGGGNLGRDLNVVADILGPESLAASVYQANLKRVETLIDRVAEADFDAESIGVLGLTYKPGTSSLRFSMALEMASGLAQKGYQVQAYDPQMDIDDPILRQYPTVQIANSLESLLQSVKTCVVCLNLEEFRELTPARLEGCGVRTVVDIAGALNGDLDWSRLTLVGA